MATPGDYGILMKIIEEILQPNNVARKAAEDEFNNLKKQPEWLVPGLCEAVRALQGGQKQMASVLLRKAVADPDVFDNLSDASRSAVLQIVLGFLQDLAPEDRLSRKAIDSAVASLGCRMVISDEDSQEFKINKWPALLPFLYKMMNEGNEDQMKSALYVFQSMAGQLENQAKMVLEMLTACLGHSSLAVRLESVSTALSFCRNLDEPQGFEALIPLIFNVLQSVVEPEPEKATEILEGFVELQETSSFLQDSGHMQIIVHSMFQLAGQKEVEADLRHMAVELLITFCEMDSRAAKKLRLPGNLQFVPEFVTFLLGWIRTEPEPDQEWHTTTENEEDVTFEDYDIGAEGLDRLALSCGGASMEKCIGVQIEQLMKSDNWQDRYAAIKALMHVAEGCREKFEPNLASLTQLIMSHLRHPHPKVRFGAGRAITQFCTDFAPGFQAVFSNQILESVSTLLADPVARVRHIASTIVVNFCEDAIAATYTNQLEALLGAYFQVMSSQEQPLFVREISFSAISAIAENQKLAFLPYYSKFMPLIKSVFALPEAKEHNTIKGLCIECVSFIALAVGKEHFINDAREIMDYMLNVTQNMSSDDTRSQYMWQAWGRLSEVMQGDFTNYLNALMPRLVAQAGSTEDIELVHVQDSVKESPKVQVMKFSGSQQKMVIHTAVLEEKKMACDIIQAFFEHVPSLMLNYIEPLQPVMCALLSNPHSPEIRGTAADICSHFFKTLKKAVEANAAPANVIPDLMKKVLPDFLDSLLIEVETKVATEFVEGLNEILQLLGDECIPMVPLQVDDDENAPKHPHGLVFKTMTYLNHLFDSCLEKIVELTAEAKEVEGDEDEEKKVAEQTDEEESFLQHCAECIGHMFRTHKLFLELFVKDFLPKIAGLFQNKAYGTRGPSCGLSLLVDFIEFGKEAAMPFFHDVLNAFWANGLTCPDSAQTASYGLGVAAVYALNIQTLPGNPGLPQDFFPKSLAFLQKVCQHHADEDFQAAIANAVGALLIFLKHYNGQPGIAEEQLLPSICPLLPVGADLIEAKTVHETVFQYVAAGNQYVVGANRCNMPAIQGIAEKLTAEMKENPEAGRLNEATVKLISEIFKL